MTAKLTREQKEALERWQEHCRQIRAMTAVSVEVSRETPAERDRRIKRLLSD